MSQAHPLDISIKPMKTAKRYIAMKEAEPGILS
jgi:hypothetical protein